MRTLRPLTERILERAPGPRPVWIAAWALVPWLNAGANLLLGTRTAVWEESDVLVALNYASVSLGIVVALWGTSRIARRLEGLHAESSHVVGADSTDRFHGMNSVVGPIVVSAAGSLVFAVSAFVRDGWASALLRGTTWLVLGIALWTFLWTYVSLQLGLGRLGRERLLADVPRADPTLGLRPLGGAAFMGLWMLLVWLVPVLLTGLPDLVGVALGLLVLGGGLAVFAFSLLLLHRQMVEVKRSELALARELYAAAYEPVHTGRSLEALERQRGLLGAADALEKRAEAIHEWPIDQATFAWVLTITTSVLAMTIGRLILDPLGL